MTMKTDGLRSLVSTIARTIGAARFLEKEAEPRIRKAVSRSLNEIERIADETEEALSRSLHQGHQGKTENSQRRVGGR